ncbi:MAG TPA: outer membrane protein assembly factor BamA [Gammaproteobacteria bacterium]|nr:outer membrane protein assembly factor BamA [Gammaproteobacteria bacterium]
MGNLKGVGVILATLVLLLSASFARADDQTFVVKKIQLIGLQRISDGTLYDYLPVNIGDTMDPAHVQQAIRALYKTGFFKDVQLRRDGDTLVVVVEERPSIAHFTITGNKLIKTEDLNKSLTKAGLSEGQIFNKVVLDGLQQDLLDQYYSHGHYGVTMKTDVRDVGDNRVDVTVTISEGITARIRSINVVGNHDFTESDMHDVFKQKVSDFWTFWGSSDEYAREKMAGDLESLRSFYMDQGYADFSVDSTEVSVSPDHNSVYITVGITEGDVYKIKDVKLSGNLVVPEDQLKPYVLLKPGDTFSLGRANATADLIRKRLGVDGYAFAQVNPVPNIDRANKVVSIDFVVDPGERTYVRHIVFNGAADTNDEVYRREMRQFEGAWLSNLDLERSRIRIQRLPWVEDASVKPVPVPGTANQVDVSFDIKERPPGTANIGVGYGSQSGLVLDGQITNANFLGTGERLSLDANHTALGHSYTFSFTDPYWTVDGVSRTWNVFQSRIDALTINSAPLTTSSYGGGLSFNIPLTEYSAWGEGLTFAHNELFTTFGSSKEYVDFILQGNNPNNPQHSDNGNLFYTPGACADPLRGFNFVCEFPGLKYNTLENALSYVYDSENRVVFPTAGSRASVTLATAVPGSDVEYNILTYQQYAFLPLPFKFVYALNSELGFGAPYGKTSVYPPFKNFFVGGPDTVRGWTAGTLGPVDPMSGYPIGGRAMFYAQNEFVLPSFGKVNTGPSQYRLAFFVDVGNAFTDPGDFKWRALRESWGFAATFLTPLGAMKFSYAFPLNAKPGDQTERFQFTLGAYY